MGDASDQLHGQCQCGNITYRIKGQPLTFYACHCRDCQQQSASAFGLSLRVAFEDFELTSGTVKFWSTPADDGSTKNCAFCPDCGTRIYHASDDPAEAISLKAGSLNNISRFRPVAHIWTKRAQQWLDYKTPGILIYADQPDDFGEIYNAWQSRGK